MIETTLQDCLKAVIDNRGVTPHKKGTEWQDFGVPVLSANNVKTSGLQKLDEIRYIPEEVYPSWMKLPLEKGDIILTSEAPAGEVLYWDFDEKVVLGQRLYGLKVKDKINSKYLKYYLQSPIGQKAIQGQNSGSTVFGIAAATFPYIVVKLLEKGEQDAAAELLYAIDSKIANNNSICSDLESMAKLLYDYWFVQFDFPDENGKPYKSSGGKMVWNEELKREIPEGWKAGVFGDVLSSLECGDRPAGGAEKDGIPSIGAENIIGIGHYDFSSEKYVSEEYFSKMKGGVVRSWDVLIYKDGAGVGQSSMFGDGFPYDKCAINSHAFILRSKDNLYQDYLYLTLNQEYVKKIIVALAMKAAQPGLNQPAVKSIPLLIPKTSVIKAFNKNCDTLFHRIFSCANENKDLASLRDFLLPMLMNGQVKVGGKE